MSARLSLLSKRDLLTIVLAYLSPDWGSLMSRVQIRAQKLRFRGSALFSNKYGSGSGIEFATKFMIPSPNSWMPNGRPLLVARVHKIISFVVACGRGKEFTMQSLFACLADLVNDWIFECHRHWYL